MDDNICMRLSVKHTVVIQFILNSELVANNVRVSHFSKDFKSTVKCCRSFSVVKLIGSRVPYLLSRWQHVSFHREFITIVSTANVIHWMQNCS